MERPISSCEVRAVKYLSETIGKDGATFASLTSDTELRKRLDVSMIAVGGSSKSEDVRTNQGNSLITLDNGRFASAATNETVLNLTRDFDYGLIVKAHPAQFPERVWFACAGRGEWGTSGAAWYLAKKWQVIHEFAGKGPFAMIVRVTPGQDESAYPEVRVASTAEVEELVIKAKRQA